MPREIAIYARTFAELASMAAYGAAARSLIATAIGDPGSWLVHFERLVSPATKGASALRHFARVPA